MASWINYHHLYYFKATAEEGTVSRAALKLRIRQPTLSAQLKQFENALGVKLFHRHHKKLVLTEHGRIALDYSKSIFKMGSEMVEALHDQLKPQRPTLHIGAMDSVPKQVVLELVQAAFEISPCQITLSEGKPEDLLKDLVAHKVDLMLTNFKPNGLAAKDLCPRVIANRTVAFYGAPKFKFLGKGFPSSISGAPIIAPSADNRLRFDLEHWAANQNIALNVIVESQDLGMKKLLAVNGMGLIPTASHAVSRQMLAGELIEIGKMEGVYEELVLLTANRKIQNPIAKILATSFSV